MKTGIFATPGISSLKFARLLLFGLVAAAGAIWKWVKGLRNKKARQNAQKEDRQPTESNIENEDPA